VSKDLEGDGRGGIVA